MVGKEGWREERRAFASIEAGNWKPTSHRRRGGIFSLRGTQFPRESAGVCTSIRLRGGNIARQQIRICIVYVCS